MNNRSKHQPSLAQNDGKLRRCLVCGDEFLSLWAGNRICKRCKSRSSWRDGT